jgi:hypothetical protein
MNKLSSENTVISLHMELLNACNQYEHYLNLNDAKMIEVWYREMSLLTEEMQDL